MSAKRAGMPKGAAKRPSRQDYDDAYRPAMPLATQGFAAAYQAWANAVMADPAKLLAWQQKYLETQAKLNQELFASTGTDGAVPPPDRWRDFLHKSHDQAAQALIGAADIGKLDPATRRRLKFFFRQYAEMAAPENFLLTNPDAQKEALETHGESLRHGVENFAHDMQTGRISMVDSGAFAVGKNLAITPGAVVYQNDIFQLLQYAPSTKQVYERPLLLVPPCINKFYILDMQPENSFVRYAVAQGHTVFLVSWRNVGPDQQHLTWDDYIAQGVIEAIERVREITREKTINLLGFCVGGTLVASALAVLAKQNKEWVESLTLLTTLLDFSDVGDIGAYIDEAFVEAREAELKDGGLVAGRELAQAFASLRARELIWSFVVNNYLKGKKPAAFDLLYWNDDSTNLPGPWYAYYLRNMYLENNLVKPERLTMCGEKVDLGLIDMPAFVFAAKEDHIVPWQSAYRSAWRLSSDVTFVLGASGHIAGTINAPSKNKRSFWTGPKMVENPEQWSAKAKETPGSWWPTWIAWLSGFGGKKIAARSKLGGAKGKMIEAAPGSYVRQMC